MSARPLAFPGSDLFGLGPDEARPEWRRFLAWGLLLAGVGAAAVGVSFAADPEAAWLVGGLLLVGGVVQVATAVRAWEWGGLRPRVLTGAVYLALGGVTAGLATGAAAWLTLLLAAGLIVGGVVRAGGAVAERFPGWGWVLASGLVTAAVGSLIGQRWPDAGPWAVGLLAGIDLAASGLSWVMFARGLRTTPAGAA
jgi:uncharacterized membrane protein HdeD (DUF308 family)